MTMHKMRPDGRVNRADTPKLRVDSFSPNTPINVARRKRTMTSG